MNENKCKICGSAIDSYDIRFRDGMCYHCEIEEDKRKLAEALQSDDETETSYEDDIVCPWCGYRYDDCLWEWGDDGTSVCGNCGKEFAYEAHTKVTYSTSRIEKQEETK